MPVYTIIDAMVQVVVLCALYIIFTPPNRRLSPSDTPVGKGRWERIGFLGAQLSMVLSSIPSLMDTIHFFTARATGSTRTNPNKLFLCPNPSPGAYSILEHRPYELYVGSSLIVGGAALRIVCYKTLGEFFTFQIGIRGNHALVMTGPYRFVRHPSYTAIYITAIGIIVSSIREGGWLSACGADYLLVRFLAVVWLSWFTWSGIMLVKRANVEDDALEARFGALWRKYNRAVPYRFIPGFG